MHSDSRSDFVQVRTDRIERIRDLLAMISLGEFDPAQHLLPLSESDGFSGFEETINLFARQLHQSARESEAAMLKLGAARSELEEKLATIERQRSAIRELSTPIIELWQDVLALPVIGEIDSARAQDMTDGLLRRIAQGKARCVIIDVTGVALIDTRSADHLLRLIAAARLLGAHCVTTGLSPSVAETLVTLGVDLSGVKTCSTLRAGLEECFRFLKLEARGAAREQTSERTAKPEQASAGSDRRSLRPSHGATR